MIKSLKKRVASYFVRQALQEIKQKSNELRITNRRQFYDTFSGWLSSMQLPTTDRYASYLAICAEIWGKALTKVKFRLYEKIDTEGNVVEVNNHPIIDLFRKPNDFQTWWEMRFRIPLHWVIFGNAYFLKLYDNLKVPRQLYMLSPDRIRIVSSRQKYIDHYEYNLGYKIVRLESSEVIHFRYPDPINPISGRSILKNLDIELDINNLQRNYLKRFYENGGFMGLTFSTKDTLDDKSWKRVNEMLQEKYGAGVEDAFKVALLESGLEPVKSAYSLKELDLKPQRELTRDEILAQFQISKVLLGESTSINRANADTALYQFGTMVVDPFADYIDEVLTVSLCEQDFGREFYIKHDSFAARDVELALKYYENGIQNGWLTANEVRKEEGYEEREEGNTLKDINKTNTTSNVKDSAQRTQQEESNIEKRIKEILNTK